jgi:hypothetical protein
MTQGEGKMTRRELFVSAHRVVMRLLVWLRRVVCGGRGPGGSQFRCAFVALALVVTLLGAGVAQASAPKLVSYGHFESKGGYGVAVDQSSGDVFVAGFINFLTINPVTEEKEPTFGHIDKFDASDKSLLEFGEGVPYAGAAVNPISGNLYVLNGAANEIDTFVPSTGAPVSSFPVPPSSNTYFVGLTAVQIATDSAGDVYVPNVPGNEVLKYSATGTLLATFTGSGARALSGPTGVAVDSSGNVWVADDRNNRVEEFAPAGTFLSEFKSEGVRALALDGHGNVLAIVNNSVDFCGSLTPPCEHLVEYNSAGAQLADFGASAFGVPSGFSLGSIPAVNDSTGRVYVTDSEKNLVWIFGPPTAPMVGKEVAVEVGVPETKLGAQVNPGGAATSYRFEYGPTMAYGQTAPFPEGDVGSGVTPRTVWAAASGLVPGTTYHYRVVTTSELGTAAGADQTFTTETAAEAGCSNEQLRSGFSASLPDCRAYELVTQAHPNSGEPFIAGKEELHLEENVAAPDGNRMAYFSFTSLPGSQTDSGSYLATRGASSWSTENVIPPQSGYYNLHCTISGAAMMAYSTDLSKGVLVDGRGQDPENGPGERVVFTGGCGADSPELVAGEPHGTPNLFLRDNTTVGYQLLDVIPPGITPAAARFRGASSDLTHVVFNEQAELTPNAPSLSGAEDLYEWSGGVVHLVAVLPDGTPVAGSFAGMGSTDGSRVFFTAGANLYVRVNAEQEQGAVSGGRCTEASEKEGKACTFQVDASQAGGPGGGGDLRNLSADGSQVFFLDDSSKELTSDTVPGSGPNLYRYEVVSGQLTDLTPQGGAEVQNGIGISEDGSYVYFIADGVLSGSQANEHGETAQNGQQNVYLWHGGDITFVATLSGADGCVSGGACARVSSKGAFLAFASHRSLTGYDNTRVSSNPAENGSPGEEIFLYNASSGRLVCASCNPSGEPPTAGASLLGPDNNGPHGGGAPHNLADNGRLFFDTPDALLPSDTNRIRDAYEYEDGQLHLISTGTSSTESRFLDASEGGNDAYLLTRQSLVPQDTEEEGFSIYDARVGGGFTGLVSPPPCTTADACRSASSPQPSVFGAPASATFAGSGNLAPSEAKPKAKPRSKPVKCRKGFVKKRSKCVKKPKGKARKSAHANKKIGK